MTNNDNIVWLRECVCTCVGACFEPLRENLTNMASQQAMNHRLSAILSKQLKRCRFKAFFVFCQGLTPEITRPRNLYFRIGNNGHTYTHPYKTCSLTKPSKRNRKALLWCLLHFHFLSGPTMLCINLQLVVIVHHLHILSVATNDSCVCVRVCVRERNPEAPTTPHTHSQTANLLRSLLLLSIE